VDGFLLAYDGFDPGLEGLREALTSTGNGYVCTRGAAEWEDADGVHYPGTYAHGGYNRETTILGGLPVLNEDLVNLPNWLVLQRGAVRWLGRATRRFDVRLRRRPVGPIRGMTQRSGWSVQGGGRGIRRQGRRRRRAHS
jgi:Glycosyl hydrolase family 65, N-terminal domain